MSDTVNLEFEPSSCRWWDDQRDCRISGSRNMPTEASLAGRKRPYLVTITIMCRQKRDNVTPLADPIRPTPTPPFSLVTPPLRLFLIFLGSLDGLLQLCTAVYI